MIKKNYFEDIPDVLPSFEDLAQCTDYFYDEFGKLDESGMDERSIKKMRKFLKELFYKALKNIKVKNNLQNKIDSAQLQNINSNLKISKKEFKQDNKLLSNKNSKILIEQQSDEEYLIDTPKKPELAANGVIKGQIDISDIEEKEGTNES